MEKWLFNPFPANHNLFFQMICMKLFPLYFLLILVKSERVKAIWYKDLEKGKEAPATVFL